MKQLKGTLNFKPTIASSFKNKPAVVAKAATCNVVKNKQSVVKMVKVTTYLNKGSF